MWWWCWKTRNNRNVEKLKSDEGKKNFFLVAERASLLRYSSVCTIFVPRISEPEPGPGCIKRP